MNIPATTISGGTRPPLPINGTHPGDVLSRALEYVEAGLSVIPIGQGSKRTPKKFEWKVYSERRPTEVEVRRWVEAYPGCGIGIVGGAVSNNLEILDLESIAPLDDFRTEVERRAPGLLIRLPRTATPSGGRHVFYRCARIEGSLKLAMRAVPVDPADVEESTKGKATIRKLARSVTVSHQGVAHHLERGETVILIEESPHVIKTLIETRGEGGQVLSPLCPPGVHPSGGVYRILNGDLKAIPTITPEEREILFSAARACNEYVSKARGDREARRERAGSTSANGLRPGEDFNQRGDVRSLLEKHGWTYFGKGAAGEHWARPGVNDHGSATLFPDGRLYVFSTNAAPLEAGESYSPFGLLAELEHGGDYSDAAKALHASGYGDQSSIRREQEARPNANKSLLDGKLTLEAGPAKAGKVIVTARQDNRIIHRDMIALDRDSERARFVKKLDLNSEQAREANAALLELAEEIPQENAKTGRGNPRNHIFSVRDDGVYALGLGSEGEDLPVCGKLEIAAYTRDDKSSEWGRLLEWTDAGGVRHTWSMPMSLLSGDGTEVRAQLLSGGLTIEAGRKAREALMTYLQTFQPEQFARCVSRVGWYGESNYVLPDETIGDETEERIVLQSGIDDYRMACSGTLEEWRENVAHRCIGNSRLVFAISNGFAAPLLRPLKLEGGGYNFKGRTSEGKSTALIVAGSVFGGGDSRLGYARTWRQTANAAEATAEMHNDGIMLLDELALCDPRDAGETVYMLASDEGKRRLRSSASMRKSYNWRLIFMSSGEISLADHVSTAGKKVRGGQEVRFCEIPADASVGFGLFEELHEFANDPGRFAKALNEACRRFYGTALREYVKTIIPQLGGLPAAYREFEKARLAEWLPSNAAGEVGRVASRFVLAAFAGELATAAGVTGWPAGEAARAAKRVFDDWLATRGTAGSTDKQAMVAQVRAFIEKHGASRFENEDRSAETITIHNRAGFVRNLGKDRKEFCILPETFKREVCQGFDYLEVAHTLEFRGMLERGEGKNWPAKRYWPSEQKYTRFFVVKGSIFESEESEESEEAPQATEL